jgi:hypothetical protein
MNGSYLDRSLQLEQDGLRDEDFTGLSAKISDLGFEQLNLLSRSAASNLKEAVDYRVEIDFVLVRHCKFSPARERRAGHDGL